jgi:type I restriction enzyme R subunit
MSEFKQIIGRGTRLRDDYGKLWFNIVDYTGSATRMFADPSFDGDPARITEEQVDDEGEPTQTTETLPDGEAELPDAGPEIIKPPEGEPRKFYYDGGQVAIVAHLVHELDPNGKQLRVVRYTDHAAETIRTLYPTAQNLRKRWADAEQRDEVIRALAERGISFEELAEQSGQPDADPFDLLCHLAFNAPLRTRRERAQRLRQDRKDFFERYSPEARQILDELLEKYAQHGDAQFVLPDVLHVPPISEHGKPGEIIRLFGSPEQLRTAVNDLQGILYGS